MAAGYGFQGEGAEVQGTVLLACGGGASDGQGRYCTSLQVTFALSTNSAYSILQANGVARPSLTYRALVEGKPGEVPDDVIAFTATQVYTGGADTASSPSFVSYSEADTICLDGVHIVLLHPFHGTKYRSAEEGAGRDR